MAGDNGFDLFDGLIAQRELAQAIGRQDCAYRIMTQEANTAVFPHHLCFPFTNIVEQRAQPQQHTAV